MLRQQPLATVSSIQQHSTMADADTDADAHLNKYS